MDDRSPTLPNLKADLLLLHAPAVFDFRERRDIYFPFLGTSGDVPITPLYEYFPVGFKSLQRYLTERGHTVAIVNLSTILLRYPKLDFHALLDAIDVKLVGIDLHWMVHVQGSLKVAEEIRFHRPDLPIIFGGISSTYYGEELIQYPFVDMVMQGYDTHMLMDQLLQALRPSGDLHQIPNLLWKTEDGRIHNNGFTYTPPSYGCGINWTEQPLQVTTEALPIREFLSTQNVGCSFECSWCGGSRSAFQRIFKQKRAMARKARSELRYEFATMNQLPDVDQYHYYTIGSYNETREGMAFFLNQVSKSRFKSISYEQYYLTPDDVLKRMAQAHERTFITISPESHDLTVAKLAGRGVYTNEEMEDWLERALEFGIKQIDIWYFVGMPQQDEKSVLETVDYCQHLLEKFQGEQVNPMICPMIPFLDPASSIFESPDKYGYRIFYRTLEEHRRGMEHASIINRINYETKWLSRRDLVYVGFDAVRRLMTLKAENGYLPKSLAQRYNAKIDDALYFIDLVHEIDCIQNEKERLHELDRIGDEILCRNNMIFFSGVMNQAFPINRQVGGRWIDEMGWEPEVLAAGQSGC